MLILDIRALKASMTRTRLFLTLALLLTSTGAQAAGADGIFLIPFMLLFFVAVLSVVITTLFFIGAAFFQSGKFRSPVAFRSLKRIMVVQSVLYLLAFGLFEWSSRAFGGISLFEIWFFWFFWVPPVCLLLAWGIPGMIYQQDRQQDQ